MCSCACVCASFAPFLLLAALSSFQEASHGNAIYLSAHLYIFILMLSSHNGNSSSIRGSSCYNCVSIHLRSKSTIKMAGCIHKIHATDFGSAYLTAKAAPSTLDMFSLVLRVGYAAVAPPCLLLLLLLHCVCVCVCAKNRKMKIFHVDC